MAPGCKPGGFTPYVGSNPTPCTKAPVAQLVEQMTLNHRVEGSSPVARSKTSQAHIAQSVERVLGKDEVTGSSPVVGFKLIHQAGC